MKFYKEGDKSKAICTSCEEIVSTTFAYRDVPFSDRRGKVKDILVAVCDRCGAVVATPAQSTPAIKAAREKAIKPVEVSLPAPFIEILDLAAFRIDPKATSEFRKRLLAFYIHRCASDDKAIAGMLTAKSDVAEWLRSGCKGPKKRLSFKVTPRLDDDFERMVRTSKLSRTDLIKTLVMQIASDIVQPKKPKYLEELRRLAVVSTC